MLAVITFGLLGFASMPNSMHNHDGKSQGKCACGTYPLYLTEAEAGGSMLNRMLKGPHSGTTGIKTHKYTQRQLQQCFKATLLQGHCFTATLRVLCGHSREQTRYYFLDTTMLLCN